LVVGVSNPTPSADLEVLAAWAPELADTFVALSCDIAMVIDSQGRIVKIAQRPSQAIAPSSWVGSLWTQTASADSQAKIHGILADVAATGQSRRREVNHPAAACGEIAIAYSAARLGAAGPLLAIGHDLRAQSALQQRFVAAQEALERSYWNAQRHRSRASPETGLMTENERASLGLPRKGQPNAADVDDTDLVRAIGRVVARIGQDELPALLRDARRLAEQHVLQQAQHYAASADKVAPGTWTTRSGKRRKKPRPAS
jgi:hypothetical protein